jgi:hypothetical protein
MRLTAVVAAVLLTAACASSKPKPKPPTPPPPAPTTPTPVCGPGQNYGCYHDPGGGWVYACPVYNSRGDVVGVENKPNAVDCPPKPGPRICPMWPLPAGAMKYLGMKTYGQGHDTSLRVRGSKEWCAEAGHANASQDCHLEGWEPRLECELKIMGGCPIWQYSQDGGQTWKPCLQEGPQDGMSCDHFGDVKLRDDPQTPVFEGLAACGAQRDERGHPMAGLFAIVHGRGKVRACLPDGTGCSGPADVDH